MRCANCGEGFKAARSDQVTCSSPCNAEMTNRELVRGRRVVRALVDWRARRGTDQAKVSLRWLAREVRHWVEEDAQAGRPLAPKHDHMRPKGHELEKRLGVSKEALELARAVSEALPVTPKATSLKDNRTGHTLGT